MAPNIFSFGTAALLAAACCIPAILSLMSMWDKIHKTNWKRRFGNADSSKLNELLPGTNAATPAKMMKTEGRIRFYLSMVEIPVFGAAVIAIIIWGELNFFSYRVAYQTEPMASIGKQSRMKSCCSWLIDHLIYSGLLGQWAPMVGTGLAALGSLYGLLAADTTEERNGSAFTTKYRSISHHHRNMSHPHCGVRSEPALIRSQALNSESPVREPIRQNSFSEGTAHRQAQQSTPSTSRRSTFPASHVTTRSRNDGSLRRSQTLALADGNRRKVAGAFEWLGEKLGTPAPDAFDDSEFQNGPAADFPTIPAEAQRNPGLPQIFASYNPHRDSQGNATPNTMLRRQLSGAGSFTESSRMSGMYFERVSTEDLQPTSSLQDKSPIERPLARRDTLEVPKPVFHSPIVWNTSSGSASDTVSFANVDGSSPITKIPGS